MSYLIGFSKENHIFLSYSGWLSVASIDSIPLWSWVIIVPEISHLNGLCGEKHCCFCIADDYVKPICHCNMYIILDKCDTYRLYLRKNWQKRNYKNCSQNIFLNFVTYFGNTHQIPNISITNRHLLINLASHDKFFLYVIM